MLDLLIVYVRPGSFFAEHPEFMHPDFELRVAGAGSACPVRECESFSGVVVGPACQGCGGPRSVAASTGLCRKCYAAKRWPDGPREKPKLTCSGCGGPRSQFAAGTRCRKCWRAHYVASRPDSRVAALTADDLAFIRTAVEASWTTPRISDEIEGRPFGVVMRAVSRIRRELGIDGRHRAIISAPTIEVEKIIVPASAPHVPRYVLPSPEAPRPPATPAPAGARVEPHPILERHARADERAEPLVRARPPRQREAPVFSPEFQAKLARVAAGAGIVEVAPVRRRPEDVSAGNSSLDFVA